MKTNRNSLITLSEFQAHVKNKKEHGGYKGASALPIGTENQTIRRGAIKWEATSVLKINTNGPQSTVDHSDGTVPRIVNMVYVANSGSLVAANTVPEGTIGMIYTP